MIKGVQITSSENKNLLNSFWLLDEEKNEAGQITNKGAVYITIDRSIALNNKQKMRKAFGIKTVNGMRMMTGYLNVDAADSGGTNKYFGTESRGISI